MRHDRNHRLEEAVIRRQAVVRALAEVLSDVTRTVRCERVFGASEDFGAGVEFEKLPEEDQKNWFDLAEAVLRVSERSLPGWEEE